MVTLTLGKWQSIGTEAQDRQSHFIHRSKSPIRGRLVDMAGRWEEAGGSSHSISRLYSCGYFPRAGLSLRGKGKQFVPGLPEGEATRGQGLCSPLPLASACSPHSVSELKLQFWPTERSQWTYVLGRSCCLPVRVRLPFGDDCSVPAFFPSLWKEGSLSNPPTATGDPSLVGFLGLPTSVYPGHLWKMQVLGPLCHLPG